MLLSRRRSFLGLWIIRVEVIVVTRHIVRFRWRFCLSINHVTTILFDSVITNVIQSNSMLYKIYKRQHTTPLYVLFSYIILYTSLLVSSSLTHTEKRTYYSWVIFFLLCKLFLVWYSFLCTYNLKDVNCSMID